MVTSGPTASKSAGFTWGTTSLHGQIAAVEVPSVEEFDERHYGDWVLDNRWSDIRYQRELTALDGHLSAAEAIGRRTALRDLSYCAVLIVAVAVILVAFRFAMGSVLWLAG